MWLDIIFLGTAALFVAGAGAALWHLRWLRRLPPLDSPAQRQVHADAKKQFPMCSLQPLTCSQVQVLPRQWMVGPSSDSRLRVGETLAGASSAVNGRVCRRSSAGGDRSAALANLQAATIRSDCRPESASFSETGEEGLLEQPNRDRNGEGSHGWGMNHQTNPVSQRGRGRGMEAQYDKAKKGR